MQGKFLISFHTLLYILLITHRKVRKIIGEYRRISEKIGENRGISEENARKIGEFPRNPFLEVGDPAVISGRFSGHFRSFLVMIPNDSAKSFLFFPFHSSTPRFYALQHKKVIYFKISSIFFWRFHFFSLPCKKF